MTDKPSKPSSKSADPNRVIDAQFLYAITTGCSAPENQVPEVAFAGRSNVGKSSLMNGLMSRKSLVRTSSTPGCTRQVNVFETRLGDGQLVRLVDLPGFGFAKRSKVERGEWADLIEGYIESRKALALVILVVDVRRGPEDEEQMLIDYVRGLEHDQRAPVPLLCVGTKADKVGKNAARSAADHIAHAVGIPTVAFSATTGEGRDEVWRAIRRVLPRS